MSAGPSPKTIPDTQHILGFALARCHKRDKELMRREPFEERANSVGIVRQ
jgi:hypothetical protein